MPAPITPTTIPATALDAEAVASVGAILPAWLASVQRAHRLTGVQAAIWHDGAVVAEAAVGPADEPAGIPLATTHRVRIASHSKMVTAMLVMALAGEGRLRLDDTVGEQVAELADSPVGPLTVRDLLSHSAGLTRDAPDSRWWQLERPFADREELLAIARADGTVLAAPGLHLQYSNIGYGLIGLVIEAVTGTTFARAAHDLLLDPLGIADIGPDLPADAAGPEDPRGFAVGHTAAVHGERRTVAQVATGALAPATGFWATAAGIAELAGRVLCDGEVIGAEAVTTMRRRAWTLTEGRHYGLGLQEGTFAGFGAIGHSGGFPTGLTRTWAVPGERLAVSVLGTSVDAPTSQIAVGILGLLALAAGRPAPQASEAEESGAGGGGSLGTPRPAPLPDQDGVELDGVRVPAARIAEAVAGSYGDLWGSMLVARLGDRLLTLDEGELDPSQGAIELVVDGTAPDPLDDTAPATVRLRTWGDVGYGSHLEPLLARIALDDEGAPRCSGIIHTGHLQVPVDELELPDRVPAPR